MPKQPRSRWRNWVELAPAWLALTALAWAPLPVARRLADWIASAVRWATPRWRRTALRNLELAYPESAPAWRERTMRDSYANLGRVLLALARTPRLTPGNIGDWIDYEGYEHFRQALEKGRGVLFLTAHLGNWELSVAAHALFGHPMRMLVRPLDNPLLDRLIASRRSLHGNRPIDKRQAAREALRALRANEAVGILADQHAAGDDGELVDFFGRPARSTCSVALLAARTGARSSRVSRSGTRARPLRPEVLSAVANGCVGRPPIGRSRRRAARQQAIERAVRESPGQWLWMHRRWKGASSADRSRY